MITHAGFRKSALSFADTEESPHFEKASFRINEEIFVTLDEKAKTRLCQIIGNGPINAFVDEWRDHLSGSKQMPNKAERYYVGICFYSSFKRRIDIGLLPGRTQSAFRKTPIVIA